MTKKEIKAKFDEIVASPRSRNFSIPQSNATVPGCMSASRSLSPRISSRRFLIVDEVLAVGDAQFQKKCLGRCRMCRRKGERCSS